MKKILIVDDNQANLDTAKAFFCTIPEFEFVYATNRVEAEKQLKDAYAVITDRSLPYSEDSLIGCEYPDGKKGSIKDHYDHANGYYILLQAKIAGKPVVMASEHGGLMLFTAEIVAPITTEKWIEKSFNLEETLQRLTNEPSFEDITDLWAYGNFDATDNVFTAVKGIDECMRSILKTEQKAWEKAWQELQKQF